MSSPVPAHPPLRVLLCGHRSFAARGLAEALRARGHRLDCFSRGAVARAGDEVTGPVDRMHENPGLAAAYDVVVNFILLHRAPLDENRAFLRSLLDLCAARGVRHLIHISSCSAYKNEARDIDEATPIEPDPARKGPYAAVKAAQEVFLNEKLPAGMKLSHVRPGLILANGMGGYIGGIGVRLPWNSLIGLGDHASQIPLVTREDVRDTVCHLVEHPPEERVEALLLADGHSPTRRQYLQAACEALGVGTRVRFFPVWMWLAAGGVGDLGARLVGKASLGILGKIRSVCRHQQFHPARSEQRLGLSFSRDWKQVMGEVFDNQRPNYVIPPDSTLKSAAGKRVCYLGFGRIVHQRHLPNLYRLGVKPSDVEAYDPQPGPAGGPVQVRRLEEARLGEADLFVVASPGPAHTAALDLLAGTRGPVLVEKPLCYSEAELQRWLDFAAARPDPVLVCHDRRYKENMQAMMAFLRRYNPGKLLRASVEFQSTPVNKESSPWLKAERASRTLLMDYGIHWLDLVSVFGRGEPRLVDCRHELNGQGETALIEARVAFENHPVDILLRQGIHQKHARLVFTFQNYRAELGFSPDVFVPAMADDGFGLPRMAARQAWRWNLKKVFGKLRGREIETSHAHALQQALDRPPDSPISVRALAPVYRLAFEISRRVYGA